MSQYVDGFVLPLRKDQVEKYREIAEQAGRIWKEHGALAYIECIGEDLDTKEMIPFPKLANAGPDETVAFSWIVYESREHRDAVNAKVMADPRIHKMDDPENPVVECKRMAYGGFSTIVTL